MESPNETLWALSETVLWGGGGGAGQTGILSPSINAPSEVKPHWHWMNMHSEGIYHRWQRASRVDLYKHLTNNSFNQPDVGWMSWTMGWSAHKPTIVLEFLIWLYHGVVVLPCPVLICMTTYILKCPPQSSIEHTAHDFNGKIQMSPKCWLIHGTDRWWD